MKRITITFITALLAVLSFGAGAAHAQGIDVELFPEGPPPPKETIPEEPPPFGGEPQPTVPGYEVLFITSEDEYDVTLATRTRPYSSRAVNQTVRDEAAAYTARWRSAGYRSTVSYAPSSAGTIQAALEGIAARYQGQEDRLRQIALHYVGHGADGVIVTTPGNRTELVWEPAGFVRRAVRARVSHAAIGAAIATAFPDEDFERLEVVGVFDACRQGGALVSIRTAVVAGRLNGVTSGVTISSTAASGPASFCLAAVGVYSGAFLDALASPSFAAIKAAHNAAVRVQVGANAAPLQALGRAAYDEYAWFGFVAIR